jgi:hypothetical protein
MLIVVHFLAGDFTGNDAAKQAIFHGSSRWRKMGQSITVAGIRD